MSRWPNKYVIGLTGNIATGKSVVRQMLQHSGAYTIDADQLAHQVMMPGAPAYKPVIQTFGKMIVGPDKRINRQLLGSIVFSNKVALEKLEQITHPIIRQGINVLVGRATKRVVVIEAIKLLEGELKDWVDEVWVVNAHPKTQYTRLVKRRNMSDAEAKKRILAQGKQADKLKQADVVIQNDGDIEKTWQQVQTEWGRLRQKLVKSTPADTAATATTASATQQAAALAATDTMTPAAPSVDVSGMTVQRVMPPSAERIAAFLTERTGEQKTRMDVMMSFTEKSYLYAQGEDNAVLALLGWTVENLVTRMDEFHLKPGVPVADAVRAIVAAVEEESKALQSEVGFIFLPLDADAAIVTAFKDNGYQPTTLTEIKVPVWREAVGEATSNNDKQVMWKQLRQDRVLQPI